MTAKPARRGPRAPAPAKTGITRSHIGVLIDPRKLTNARNSTMLERLELAELSQALELRRIAVEENIDVGPEMDHRVLRQILADAGVDIFTDAKGEKRSVGVSRDAIAKWENGERPRPKITTLRMLITALNHARAVRGKPPIDVENLELTPPGSDNGSGAGPPGLDEEGRQAG
jgi:DNA-binding XRE family transcriptional regulator